MMEVGKNKNDTFRRVTPLLNSALLRIVDFLPNYLPSLEVLPSNIKDKFIHLLSKRGKLTDENVSLILHSKVQMLDFSDCDISDEGVHKVASVCSQLKKIDLNSITKNDRTGITSAGIRALAQGCRQLQVVYLRRCTSLTDDAVVCISQYCPQLRYLNIGGCTAITDVSLQALGENTKFLRSLNITKANVTDDGIISLVSGNCCKTLKELHLVGCQHITDESVEAVLQFCPNIQILLFHNCPLITDQSRIALEEFGGQNQKMKQVTWTVY